jgi:hypothetical protein
MVKMTTERSPVTIRKLDLAGKQVFAYSGEVVARTPTAVVVEAYFTFRDRHDLGYTVFERNDRFVEYFYTDRWYNIFESHAAGDAARLVLQRHRPAEIVDGRSARWTALDVFIYPDGRMLVLDERVCRTAD